MPTTGTDIRWAILGTIIFVAMIHLAAAKEARSADPWDQLLADLETALSAVEVAGV